MSWKLDKVPLKSTHQTVVCLLMVFLIESESSITYVTPKKQNLLLEAERFKENRTNYTASSGPRNPLVNERMRVPDQ